MDKTITVYSSFEEMKAAELRDWQTLPPHVRLRAVAEMTLAAYGMKEPSQDVPRMDRAFLVHLRRPTNARKCVGELSRSAGATPSEVEVGSLLSLPRAESKGEILSAAKDLGSFVADINKGHSEKSWWPFPFADNSKSLPDGTRRATKGTNVVTP